MSHSSINPDLLYEALGREIADMKHAKKEQDEVLSNTRQEYEQLLLKINENMVRLEEMYGKPVPVDMEGIRGEHERIRETLKKDIYLPNWLAITVVSFALGLGVSLCCNVILYQSYRKYHRWFREVLIEFKKLEGQVSKKKGRK